MTKREEQTILLTGVNGQVGFELARSLQGLGKVVALDRSELDLGDLDQVRRVVREVKPGLIVNPAAHTAVDKAETDVEAAVRLNAEAPRTVHTSRATQSIPRTSTAKASLPVSRRLRRRGARI